MPPMYVLPSNGVPAESSFALESITSDRVLRDRCTNSQHDNLYRSSPRSAKFGATSSPIGKTYEAPTSASSRATLDNPAVGSDSLEDSLRPQGDGGLQIWDNELEFRYLKRHLDQCESYIKYRSGGGKEGKVEEVWPPDYEMVFWRGKLLVCHIEMGR